VGLHEILCLLISLEYETRTLTEIGDFGNGNICILLNKNSGDDTLIPSILCYLSVEAVGPTTPSVFKPD